MSQIVMIMIWMFDMYACLLHVDEFVVMIVVELYECYVNVSVFDIFDVFDGVLCGCMFIVILSFE